MLNGWIKQAGLTSLGRSSLQAINIQGERYGGGLRQTLSTFSLRTEEDLVIPLSELHLRVESEKKGSAIFKYLRLWILALLCTSQAIHSLRTSLRTCSPPPTQTVIALGVRAQKWYNWHEQGFEDWQGLRSITSRRYEVLNSVLTFSYFLNCRSYNVLPETSFPLSTIIWNSTNP